MTQDPVLSVERSEAGFAVLTMNRPRVMNALSSRLRQALTGNFLSARQALDWGLVNRVVAPDELLPQARALALDMLSVVPQMLVDYKKLIDDGYAASFGKAMEIELERARAANAGVSAEEIERRRGAIRERGHAQAQTPAQGPAPAPRNTPD